MAVDAPRYPPPFAPMIAVLARLRRASRFVPMPIWFVRGRSLPVLSVSPSVPALHPPPNSPSDAAPRFDARRWARRGLVIIVAAATSPVLGAIAVGAVGAKPVLDQRRETRRRREAVHAGLAEAIELFAVALHNGHNVVGATRQVRVWVPGELGDGLDWCLTQVAQGRPLADALEDLPDLLGAPIRPLIAALVANERYGAPIIENLARLAADERADARRRAEAAARRLPVVLLFPLVICVLPAFLLLTVIPVVAETLAGFDFLASPP